MVGRRVTVQRRLAATVKREDAMKLVDLMLTAASGFALAMAALPATALAQAGKENLDANGVPCAGELDGAHQCMRTTKDANRPYRRAGQSDGRLDGPGRGFNLGAKELIYAAVPGSIVVLDAKDHYNFVKRIAFQERPAPVPLELVSAMMADPVTNMIYVSTRGRLIAIDLLTEKIVWENTYEPGTCCERGAISPDGLTLIVGSDLKNFHRVIDARTGKVIRILPTPLSMFNHNMTLSPDGKIDFAAPNGLTMTLADVDTGKTIRTITFDDHVRVFVINHDATRIYANLNNLLGFQITDATNGKMLQRVEVPGEMWKAKWADPNLHFYGHGAPMHGIALTPDESEVWIPDAINNQVLVFDNVGDTPKLNLSKTIKTEAPNGWITMGLDGNYAYMASGDVVDTRTHKIVGYLRDEYGRHMDSEKVLDMQFDTKGRLVRTVNQFSNGVASAVEARRAAQKMASN
jgi:DNA-binding beta-propeller fold protein YncE